MEQPIRVLHVFGGLDAGGAESRTMDIYRHIDKDIVQFDFLIHTHKEGFFEKEITKLGGRIYRVPRLTPKTIFSYQKAIKSFFESHPEYKIVHGHMLSTAFIYLKVAKAQGVQIRIAHSRSGSRAQTDIVSKVKNLTDKLNCFYSSHMFAVSELAGYGAFGKKKVELGEVKIIPNAINSKKFVFNQSTREHLRKQMSVTDEFVVGHVGRFTPQKNHLFLLDVFSKIIEKLPNSKLFLIGDGPMKQEIKNKITKLSLDDSVELLGVRDDVRELYQVLDVLLFPSTHEGLPGVVLEAQAAGLSSIISDSITKEVKITNLVEYISLNRQADLWAEKTIKIAFKSERMNTYDEIVKAGYDIVSVAKYYEGFYLESSEGSKRNG